MQAIVDVRCTDVIDGLRAMPAGSVQCVITSPPYFSLRDYFSPPRTWSDGEICAFGLERTVDGYIRHLVEVFSELKRVLHSTGTFWLNLGDCYAGGGKHVERKEIYDIPLDGKPTRSKQKGMSGKNLLMIPARAALALQSDGWILRQDIIWAKSVSFDPGGWVGSVMPESVQDRCVWSHEHLFHFALNDHYFYDIEGCREPLVASTRKQLEKVYTGQGTKEYAANGVQNPSDVKRRVLEGIRKQDAVRSSYTGFNDRYEPLERGRNLRNVWCIPKQNFKGAHFATFSENLVSPVIKVATPAGGVCATCGMPFKRQTELSAIPDSVTAAYEASRSATATDTCRTDGHTQRRPNHRRRVLGTTWVVQCVCASAVAAPAVVLDPFCGSGRTGIVAHKLGRSFIGFDVNDSYVTMARKAILGGGHHDDTNHDDAHETSGQTSTPGPTRRAEAVADTGVVPVRTA